MSLYNKYRPKSFKTIYGNEQMVRTLQGLLKNPEKAPHAYLLKGETGCGKTTIGRIIAKELGCHPQDFVELDTADLRGIDTVREIRKRANFLPLAGRCRVWLVDECHKLTNDAQNAFLKLLENPPPHAYFILATTDPQKLIKPVVNRCSVLQVMPLSDNDMFQLLRKIAKKEKATLEKEIYELLIDSNLGRPRDAIQHLEQVLSVPMEDRMGIAEKKSDEIQESIELCKALLKGKGWKIISNILKDIKGQDPENVRRQVLGYVTAVILNTDSDRAGLILEVFSEPLYDSLFPGLVGHCYTVVKTEL